MALARRSRAKIDYNGRDVSDTVIDFAYTDDYDKTDNISIRFSDREGRWLNEWFPETGDTFTAEIEIFDWSSPGDNRTRFLGEFEIDNPEHTDTFAVSGVSVPITSNVRSERKNRAWVDVSLSEIAEDITGNAGLRLVYDTDIDPFYDNADQNDKSDLAFLEELCKSDGLCLKITRGQLIIYEESKYEAEPAVITIRKGSANIKGHPRFNRVAKDIYRACEIKYFCPKINDTYIGYFEDPNASDVGHTLKLRENYNSEYDDISLDRKARARLREKNKYEWTCDIELTGDIIYFTGINVQLEGWGRFDGKYHIYNSSHNINNGGYDVSLRLRRCLEGY